MVSLEEAFVSLGVNEDDPTADNQDTKPKITTNPAPSSFFAGKFIIGYF